MQEPTRKESGQKCLGISSRRTGQITLSRVATGFLVLSFLVQAFGGFGITFTTTAYAAPASSEVASSVTANSYASSSVSDDNGGDKHATDRQSNGAVKAVSGVEQFNQLQQQLQKASLPLSFGSNQAVKPTTMVGVLGSATSATTAPRVVKPNILPTFAHTYYAKKTTDDTGTNPGDCNLPTNTDCSLRAALTVAASDGHGTSPDLVVTVQQSTANYTVGSTLVVPAYVYISSSSDLSCSTNNNNLTVLNFASETAGNTGLVLSGNDYANELLILQSKQDGLVINGSSNQVTCSISELNTNNGIVVTPNATNNQIGGVNTANQVGPYLVEVVVDADGSNGIVISGTNTTGNSVENTAVSYVPNVGAVNDGSGGILIGGGASNNQIGGNGTKQRNYIGGEPSFQLAVTNPGTNNNKIYNNYIGTDITGTTAVVGPGTSNFGVAVVNGPSGTVIGGDRNQGYGNLINNAITSTTNFGIALGLDSNTIVQGNLVGVNAALTGTLASITNTVGIAALGGSLNDTIGGEEDTAAHLGNIVGGNIVGIFVGEFTLSTPDTNTSVYGNYIGTDSSSHVLSNGYGVLSEGVNGLNIGGTGTGQGNFIGGSGYSGILVAGTYTNTTGVVIQSNTIGIKPDHSGPLYNGSSLGDNSGNPFCSPNISDTLSETCDGITVESTGITNTSGYIPGPLTKILSNTIAANDTYSGSNNGTSQGPAGIRLDYVSNNLIQGNSIGAYINGSSVISYLTNIDIELINGSSNNQIGGDRSLGQGNLLAASSFDAIAAFERAFVFTTPVYGSMTGNKIQGNAIGVDFNGNNNATLSSPGGYNSNSYGLEMYPSVVTQTVSNNIIGVDFTAASPNLNLGNLIGNQRDAIYLSGYNGNPSDSNQINGNYIGVNLATTSASASNRTGISASYNLANTRVQGNYIGETGIPITATSYGIYLYGPITSTTIISNYVGTNASGANFGTTYNVWLDDSYTSTISGPNQTLIKNNTIAYATKDGIKVGDAPADPASTQRNTISQNSIYQNGNLGINLNYITGTTGVAGGSDSGPNNQAQPPTILTATVSTQGVNASGTANPNSIIEVFLADSPSITNAQGKIYLGSGNADSSGNFVVATTKLPTGVILSNPSYLVATSTLNDPSHPNRVGSTSQFSPAFNAAVSYNYYLPFVANNSNNFTTYLAFQNVGTAAAHVSIQFYDTSGTPIVTNVLSGAPNCNPVPQYGECLPTNPFNSGGKGTGIITSDQPLNVIVPEATPYGGSAYAVGSGSSDSLIAPFALNNAFGDFTTQLNIFNGGASAATATVTFYGTVGTSTTLVTSTTSVNVPAHQTTNLNQNTLPSGFSGWAQITGSASTLVAQVLEQSPSTKFVAIANAIATPNTTEYAPAIFNNGYGSFYTGANIINPNSSPVTVTVTYYDLSANATPTTPFVIPAFGVASIFNGGTGGNGLPSGGLPSGYIGAVAVNAVGGPIAMSVNENGGLTSAGNSRSGTYAAIANGGSMVGLPVVSNGGYTYTTGATILNTSSQSVTATITYYNTDGSSTGVSKTFTIAGHGSQAYYQGDGSLPANFYGTAVITETSGPANSLIVTTNAQNIALFYTYSEPNL